MSSRLHCVEISNFKAFRKFKLELEGRHLLIYGPNGSGKSSLYWALYTFLRSARKPTAGVVKYFDPAEPQNLLNIHEQSESSPNAGEIAITLRNNDTKDSTIYRISQTTHETRKQPEILKGELASDFITYRFFFGFSHFRNSEKFDVWPLFESEILPFCVSSGGQVPLDVWSKIRHADPNPGRFRGQGGTRAYRRFSARTKEFATLLPGVVDSISAEAQRFYDQYFARDDSAPIRLRLGVTRPPSFVGTNHRNSIFRRPIIEFGLQVDGKTIARPQSFVNEAKLTQLALSVRFAASLVNLHESELKLLVLDDLLVSLDMSNRMKVVEILLSDVFGKYQKIVLTHELGFYREFRRTIGSNHPKWCFLHLEGTAADRIEGKLEKSEIERAEDYLHGFCLDEAALCLRKACEDTVRRFVDGNDVIPTKQFRGLADGLRRARSKVLFELPVRLYQLILKNTPEDYIDLIVGSSDEDITNNSSLDEATKGKLMTSRNRLRMLLTGEHAERLRQVALIDKVLACTERVLNPAAHAGSPPLYEKEIHDALLHVKDLEASLRDGD